MANYFYYENIRFSKKRVALTIFDLRLEITKKCIFDIITFIISYFYVL